MSEAAKDRREMSLREKLGVPEASEPPWSLTSAAAPVFAMFVCLTIIGPALVAVLTAGDVNLPSEWTKSWAIGMALTAVFVLVRQRSSEASWRALRLTRGELPLALALLVGVAGALTVDLVVSLASGGFWPVPQIWYLRASQLENLIVAALLAVFLQPLAETLVFQAVLLPRLRWSLGPWRGVVATAAVYVIVYLLVFIPPYPFYDRFWHGGVFPAGSALLFCLLKVYTKSTVAVLVARMGAGLIFLLMALAIFAG